MSRARRGEVWQVDFGLAAKVRPALLLTDESDSDDELDVVTMVLHTTSLRGNNREVAVSKPFLRPGAFHCQQVQTVSATKLLRLLGVLTPAEMERVCGVLAGRLGL
jgi:mRNA interferase MazF